MQIDEALEGYEKIFPAEIFLTENFGKEAGFERKNITNNLIQQFKNITEIQKEIIPRIRRFEGKLLIKERFNMSKIVIFHLK